MQGPAQEKKNKWFCTTPTLFLGINSVFKIYVQKPLLGNVWLMTIVLDGGVARVSRKLLMNFSFYFEEADLLHLLLLVFGLMKVGASLIARQFSITRLNAISVLETRFFVLSTIRGGDVVYCWGNKDDFIVRYKKKSVWRQKVKEKRWLCSIGNQQRKLLYVVLPNHLHCVWLPTHQVCLVLNQSY